MDHRVAAVSRPSGEIRVPGDKSIAHRALLLGAVATGTSRIDNLPTGADVASTWRALAALGVPLRRGSVAEIHGVGLSGLQPPTAPLNCGNSGTTMRLLCGLLAGMGVEATLTGDRSLRARPMNRIAEPLRAMGARVHTGPSGRPPVAIAGRAERAVVYRTPVPSAQVKSAILLAALCGPAANRRRSSEPTRVIESIPTRDHTERLLSRMGVKVEVADRGEREIALRPVASLTPLAGRVPGDVSSAAYWLGLAAATPGSDLGLPGVGVNPTRRAIIDILGDWGAVIEETGEREEMGEPLASLRVRGAACGLRGGRVTAAQAPRLIDELPLLAALAPLTSDGVEIRGATELRVKESDRLATTCAALRAVGVLVEEFPDGLFIAGGQCPHFATIDAAGDHRIALAFAVLGAARAGIEIRGAAAAAVSYPEFFDQLEALR